MAARGDHIGLTDISGRGTLCRCAIASKWNVEGGLHRVVIFFFLGCPFLFLPLAFFFPSLSDLMDGWVDGFGRCPADDCRDAGKSINVP